MKDNTNLFIVNEEGVLDINKQEARTVPEYKELIVRDKGSVGDHEGRKKLIAFRELLYVYLVCHPSSMYRDLPDKAKAEQAKSHCLFPKDWEPDEVIEKACIRFKEDLELSALHYSYVNASKGVYGVGQDLAFFNTRREQLRAHIKYNTNKLRIATDEEQVSKLHKEIDRDTNSLLDIGSKILTMSNALPNAFKTMEDLRKKLADEGSIQRELYGGGKLNNREE